MQSLSSFLRTIGTFTAPLPAAAALHDQADAAGRARLDALRQTPEVAGELVYRGAVFAQQSSSDKALFNYERRVSTIARGLSAAHITSDVDGTVIIAEEARFTPAYALQRFDVVNEQAGFSGSVVVSREGRRLEYRLSRNGKLSTASDDVTDPVVTGPTLYGFVLQHWEALASGQAIPVRMIVLAEKTTYGFVVRRLAAADGLTSFSITPSSALVRLAIAPLKVTFDSATRALVGYEGRVPPMQADGRKLKTLDARIDYTMLAPVYR
jgi:hypothetical protein